ncbi:hypothetical protein GJU40_17005 [Bacillus lacus]|uniref:Histidine phosphatase family protein n=1 Tax=Metabacillus lacus TaxID=1983721 RepID=A0A7X2J240_9BACI|nr:hypothetical protein [Metabacillus lacus]
MKHTKFQGVYTSTSERTIETAKLLLGERGTQLIHEENLREISLGEWEGPTHEEIKVSHAQHFQHFWESPHLYEPAGGETFQQLMKRAATVLDKIVHQPLEGNVLIVTHAVMLKAI